MRGDKPYIEDRLLSNPLLLDGEGSIDGSSLGISEIDPSLANYNSIQALCLQLTISMICLIAWRRLVSPLNKSKHPRLATQKVVSRICELYNVYTQLIFVATFIWKLNLYNNQLLSLLLLLSLYVQQLLHTFIF